MINTEDQEQLFMLIADYIEKDLVCVAIGGTAMMFMGYKTTTKDIDLVFDTKRARQVFIKAIEQLGYREQALMNIYDEEQKKHRGKPIMYTRGEERFDLFVKNVFGYALSTRESFTERRDYLGKNELTIHLLTKEHLVLLKAITHREKDYEDIETILEVEKNIDWEFIVEQAIRNKKNNSWILIDLEKTLRKLQEKYFIKEKIFKKIYATQS